MSLRLRGKKVVIFGGNGFIGSHLTNYLCKESCQVKIVSRKKKLEKKFFLVVSLARLFSNNINYDNQSISEVTKIVI